MTSGNGLNKTGRCCIPADASGTHIMANEDPLAWFITWTVYGCHLQGATSGWRKPPIAAADVAPSPEHCATPRMSRTTGAGSKRI
jgi:hypothetical protein